MADNEFVVKLVGDLSAIERDLANLTNRLAATTGGLREVGAATDAVTAKSKTAAAGQKQLHQSLATTRYALYDVSRGMAVAGIALVALGALPAKVAISFQRDFANVSRTVQGAGADTKQALIDLTLAIPASFKSLTEIATLGGQLGIAKGGIIAFTDTVAKLTATTNLSAEVAGTALGRFLAFGLVTSDQFANLASAILKVGVNSVATESQIVGIATGVAGIGKVAGLSASTLIGYAGALASVGIQQYAARGSTQRLLTSIQKATINGGSSLQTFAKISGYSADSIKKSFGTSAFSPIFEALIKNLGDTSRTGTDLNTTLGKLGISSVIDRRTLLQLAAAPKTVARAFADASSGIKNSSTLNEQYGKIASTTTAKITILGNAFQAFLNSVGSSTTGPLGQLASGLTDLLKAFTDLANNPVGQWFIGIASVAAVLTGVILLLGAGGLRAAGSLLGLVTALEGITASGTGAAITMSGLNARLAATGTLGKTAAFGLRAVGVAAKGLALAGLVFAALELGNALGHVSLALDGTDQKLAKLQTAAAGGQVGIKKYIDGANAAYAAWQKAQRAQYAPSGGGIKATRETLRAGISNPAGSLPGGEEFGKFLNSISGNSLVPAIEQTKAYDRGLAQLAKSGNISQAKQELDALRMSGLAQGQSLKDTNKLFPETIKALKQFSKGADAAVAANKALDASAPFNLTKTLKDLTGLDDKGITKYAQAYAKSVAPLTDFNNIVKTIQDTQKAALDAQLAASGDQATAAQQATAQSVSLASLTKQYQINNDAQRVWAGNLAQLAAQAGPAAAQPFIDAGYSAVNNSILQQLVNATPAQRDAYIAAQQESADLASAAMATRLLASGFLVTAAGGSVGLDTAKKLANGISAGLPVEAIMAALGLRFRNNAPDVTVNTSPAQDAIDGIVRYGNHQVITIPVNAVGNAAYAVNPGGRMIPQGATGGLFDGKRFAYASGGPVRGPGSGTSDNVPAWLSNGEYVIKAAAVRAVGHQFLNAVNKGYKPRQFASGGPVTPAPAGNSGMGVMELGPQSMGVLRQMVAKEFAVYLGDEQVARASNRGNSKLNGKGAR